MTEANNSIRRLIEAVYLRTIDHQLTWTFNPASDSCETEIGPGYLEVVQETSEEGDYYSYIQIRNSEREIVEAIYGGSLGKGNKPSNTGHKDYWELMRDLRSQAYRSAMGADKVVSGMIADLNAGDLAIDDDDDIPF